ncbi:alpha amylase C-terminal domain-containing protein, partial [Streptococcus equi]|uniref:alpha amylase C-terminal domain-containing protein n=1 Tax=Streptococcus equi TaxID=1336 RepID=UPI0022ABB490
LAPLRKKKSSPGLWYNTQQRWINDQVLAFERKFGNDVALVAVNKDQTMATQLVALKTALPAGKYADELGGLLGGKEYNGIS